MEDQKVSFHVAKIAYELGFRIKTQYVYDEGFAFPKKVLKSFSMSCIDDFKGRYCYMPTQSLLQKYLREKFNLHLTVIHRNDLANQEESFDWLIEGKDVLYRRFKTWEEALEDGLMEGSLMIRQKIALENNKLS
jgi:hypothetical protein